MPYVDIGGSSNNIMEVIGLKTKTYPIKSKEAQELLTNKNRNKKRGSFAGFSDSNAGRANQQGVSICPVFNISISQSNPGAFSFAF